MSGRRRGAAFAVGALVCGALAAAATGGGAGVEAGGGALRAVVVTRAALGAEAELSPEMVADALEVRRVPDAFAPPDAIHDPMDARGLRLAVPVPAGSYLTAGMLKRPGGSRTPRDRAAARGGTPVELAVTGAGALVMDGEAARRVDVVVSGGGGPGPARRTYLAARAATLLDLRRARGEPGLGERHMATLALNRTQALRLIRAESEGATIRLLAAR